MKNWITWLFILVPFAVIGQNKFERISSSCSELGQKFLSDTSLNIWTYPGLTDNEFFCLGKFFAKYDYERGSLFIQTYGDPSNQNQCQLCKYNEIGIYFNYHFDIISNETTQFIEGYNSVSKSLIRDKFGSNIFTQLDSLGSNSVSPQRFMDVFKNRFSNNLKTGIINDSIINVKIDLDSVGYIMGIDLNQLTYEIMDMSLKQTFTLDYYTLKSKGFLLRKGQNDKYFFIFKPDFSKSNDFCYCKNLDKLNTLIIPIKLNQK